MHTERVHINALVLMAKGRDLVFRFNASSREQGKRNRELKSILTVSQFCERAGYGITASYFHEEGQAWGLKMYPCKGEALRAASVAREFHDLRLGAAVRMPIKQISEISLETGRARPMWAFEAEHCKGVNEIPERAHRTILSDIERRCGFTFGDTHKGNWGFSKRLNRWVLIDTSHHGLEDLGFMFEILEAEACPYDECPCNHGEPEGWHMRSMADREFFNVGGMG